MGPCRTGGHAGVPPSSTHTPPLTDQGSGGVPNDVLVLALGSIRVLGLERPTPEMKLHLEAVGSAVRERKGGAADQVLVSGVLPVLAASLRGGGPLTQQAARLVAELAQEPLVRRAFGEAGLLSALTWVLTGSDQNLLLLTAQTICCLARDRTQQEVLLRQGAVRGLVSVLLRGPARVLEASCLQALCLLSNMGEAAAGGMGLLWEKGPALRGEEDKRVYQGVPPHAGGFISWVTQVQVERLGEGQYTCSVEDFQRCSASFWRRHGAGGLAGGRHRLLPSRQGFSSGVQNLLSAARDLKTRAFQTLL